MKYGASNSIGRLHELHFLHVSMKTKYLTEILKIKVPGSLTCNLQRCRTVTEDHDKELMKMLFVFEGEKTAELQGIGACVKD